MNNNFDNNDLINPFPEQMTDNLTPDFQHDLNTSYDNHLSAASDSDIHECTGTFYHEHYLVKETPIGAINAPSEHNFGNDDNQSDGNLNTDNFGDD